MIFVSTLGNFLYFSTIMYNKILQNNKWNLWDSIALETDRSLFEPRTKAAIETSCFFSNSQWWLFRQVWLIPYLFRSFRL